MEKKKFKREGYVEFYFDANGVVIASKMQTMPAKRLKARSELFNLDYFAKAFNCEEKNLNYALNKLEVGDNIAKLQEYIEISQKLYQKKSLKIMQEHDYSIRAKSKQLSIEELVGVCRFEFVHTDALLSKIEVDFLIDQNYDFSDVSAMQKEILTEVAKRLQEHPKFKRKHLKLGYFSAKMSYGQNPKSIRIIFSFKDNLLTTA